MRKYIIVKKTYDWKQLVVKALIIKTLIVKKHMDEKTND